MSYDTDDFIVMTDKTGSSVIINISEIKFVVEGIGGFCRVYFNSGEDDYIVVKATINEFMELL